MVFNLFPETIKYPRNAWRKLKSTLGVFIVFILGMMILDGLGYLNFICFKTIEKCLNHDFYSFNEPTQCQCSW